MIKKISMMDGNLSCLISELERVRDKYGDIDVCVCGVSAINVYLDEDSNTILLDDEVFLDDEEDM